jgi:uncharacterized membrane protein
MTTETKDVIRTTGADEGEDHVVEIAEKATFGLDENVAGALSYLFGFVTGLVFYFVEDDNEFVRFHAAQSMFTFGGIFALSILLGIIPLFLDFIPVVGWMIGLVFGLTSLLLGPVAFVLWLVLLIKAYKGEMFKLPVVGDMAENYV